MSFEEAVVFALTLPDTEQTTSYGKPAVRVAGNGRAFLFPGHEAQESFCLAIDRDTVEMLKETGPETFYQTAHYAGYDAVLVRYDSPDDERVRDTIAPGPGLDRRSPEGAAAAQEGLRPASLPQCHPGSRFARDLRSRWRNELSGTHCRRIRRLTWVPAQGRDDGRGTQKSEAMPFFSQSP